ncbi:MAG TPA: ATP-binding protein [Polyangiaceae bacterium]|nr:ATP-binding protein [Polyangiaceae bacterium]
MTDRSPGTLPPPPGRPTEGARLREQPQWRELEELLGRYLSPIIVQGIFTRLGGAGLHTATITRTKLSELLPHLDSALRLFVDPSRQAAAQRELEAFTRRGVITESMVSIALERDIGEARAHARLLCDHAEARPFVAQRAVTIVSELARNIFKYAGSGRIELAVTDRILRVVAADEGPGIPHVEEVLAGRYKSRTGLGKGLTGVRRLADGFDVRTGPSGTRVEAVVDLKG